MKLILPDYFDHVFLVDVTVTFCSLNSTFYSTVGRYSTYYLGVFSLRLQRENYRNNCISRKKALCNNVYNFPLIGTRVVGYNLSVSKVSKVSSHPVYSYQYTPTIKTGVLVWSAVPHCMWLAVDLVTAVGAVSLAITSPSLWYAFTVATSKYIKLSLWWLWLTGIP